MLGVGGIFALMREQIWAAEPQEPSQWAKRTRGQFLVVRKEDHRFGGGGGGGTKMALYKASKIYTAFFNF